MSASRVALRIVFLGPAALLQSGVRAQHFNRGKAAQEAK